VFVEKVESFTVFKCFKEF